MPYITLNSEEPGIRGLLRFRPETGRPISDLAEVLLRGPGTLTRGERELIGGRPHSTASPADPARRGGTAGGPAPDRSGPRRPSPAGAGQAGWILAFRWNRLPGSYSALIRASRSYLAGP